MTSAFMYSTQFRKRLLAFVLAVSVCFQYSFAQNEIVTENLLTGNPSSEWDISGAGDLTIQGFATDISVDKGNTIHFKINTDAAAYTISIYRLGYYQGNGARLITSLGSFTGTVQPSPNTNAGTGIVDCSNWSESASWAVPSTAVSGVYIAKLTRTDNNGSSHIPFVVRDDAGNSDLLFKTSDATWQAYNVYGGNSLYVGSTSYSGGHAVKVSYNRPFITRAGGGGGGVMEDMVFNAEYPMIRFLERNGYDVSYTTDVDMDRDVTLITPSIHKVLLSVGHDEYWSANERAKFEAARNAGVHLAFFSGNEVYWKTRWEDNHRTLVCYKEGTLGENVCNGECDPDPEWTGLWRDGCSAVDGTGGCNPENALSGQISWYESSQPITVPDTYKNLRFWRNTSVALLGSGQTETLTDGTLGYEWDYEQYVSSYPDGRITLSSTTVGDKIHKLSLYRHSSGALVFGAGSVQWSWGLDDNHDRGNAAPSQSMQQATVNLLADMGVQPATLMAGLTAATASTDNTAPAPVITFPVHNGSVQADTPVNITGTASDAGGVIAGIEISFDGGLTWLPVTGTTTWSYSWIPSTPGTYSIRVRGFDDSGNMGVPGVAGSSDNITVNVTAGLPGASSIFQPTDVPAVPLTSDPQGAIEVGVKFRVTQLGYIHGIRYYKGDGVTGTHIGQLWTGTGTLLAEATFINETASGWQEILFSNPVSVSPNITYVAAYHSASGQYSITNPYFTSAVVNGPLRALASGEDGANGVYKFTATPSFPNNFYQSSNYWVDVVFTPNNNPDATPPVVTGALPLKGSSVAGINTSVTATFSEDIDPSTVNASSFELRDAGNALVPSVVSYVASARMARLVPNSPLTYGIQYTVTIKGGALGIKDLAGNPLVNDSVWTFKTITGPLQNPQNGPGGPVLVISSAANPFSLYAAEILRAEGLNHFTVADISTINASVLNNYDVAILGDITVDAGQVGLLTDWVNAGGTLIAFKPGSLLAPLMGLSAASGTLSDKYLLVNTASGPGTGIVNQTIQYHGDANLHTLNGATSLATLYSDASTATANPAVTTITVGTNGGRAVAFTYDLARSIVYTRQGNPAWAGQKRDGTAGPTRSDDLFYPDWIDFNKIAIPQADEQQRLLANIILQSNLHRKPLPRFWYLPRDLKAAIVMTGDDHDNNGTIGRFNQYLTLGPNTQAAIENWTAVRGTSYVYPSTPITNSEATAMEGKGFEIALHATTGCTDFSPASIISDINSEITSFSINLPGVSSPATNRTHCMPWSDWASHAKAEAQNGIRLDMNYYYWPGAWVQNRPGLFTGSGMPMRFADINGALIDVYQAPTQMTDESGIGVADFCDALLDKAIGAEGYYGVFTANMHTDTADHTGSNAIIASAQARGIPVISAKQLLTWLDGRNNSYFGNITWNGSVMSFQITAFSGAYNLRAMLPIFSENAQLISLSMNGSPLLYTTQTIKGMQYAFFDVAAGTNNYTAVYSDDNIPPVITNVAVTTNVNGSATITWNTDEPSDSRVDYGTVSTNLSLNQSNSSLVTSHTITLTGLAPVTTYYFRVTSKDMLLNSATSPILTDQPASFVMPAYPCVIDQTEADFSLGTTDAGTTIVTEGDGDIILQPVSNQDFSGNTVPAGWGSAAYSGSGSITVNNGAVTVSGAHIYSDNSYGPGSTLDFVATFNFGSFQGIGFSADQPFNTGAWVTLGQAGADGNLYARGSDGSSINIGAGLLGTPHRYLIKWNADNFEFYIDGNSSPAATLNFTLASNMYAQISDFPLNDGVLSVDRIRVIPYAAAGTFTSRVFDAGTVKPWGAITWSSSVPASTGIAMFVRTGNTPTPDGTWSDFLPVAASGNSVGASSQYIQYRTDMTTSDARFTPVLRDVVIECSSPPLITTQPTPVTICDNNSVTFTTAAGGFPVPSVQWQVSSNGTDWADINGATGTTLTFTATLADNNKQYRAVWTNTVAIVNSNAALLTVNAIPAAPTVTVVNNCASSELTATGFTGTLLWSNNATTTSIVVTDAAVYTVTQTVSGCVSPAGNGTSAPKPIPAAPAVTVANNCGNSELTATGFTGTLLWSNNATSTSIVVTDAATYTVTQTIDGCVSPNGSGVSAPKIIPSAPAVSVVNNCGYSVLTASGYTGALLWSTGETTASITAINGGSYSVTQTINGCVSPVGGGVADPKVVPAAPGVTVMNNCGNSVLTASGYTGSLLWSNNATTASITVTNAATYTATQTINGCVSPVGTGVAAPKVIPSAPVVTVANNCGTSLFTASGYTGTLFWSNGATTSSITVPAGTYTVNQTINGCVSPNGSGIAAPAIVPAVPRIVTVDNCGNSLLTASNYTGTLLWNTGETTPAITVNASGIYTVTQTIGGCTSPRIETRGGKAAPKTVPPPPVVSVEDNCGNSILTASNYTGILSWSNGGTTPAITVTSAGTYSAAQTGTNGCISNPAPVIATPKIIPDAPVITANGPTIFCEGGSVILTTDKVIGNNWSTGASTQNITTGTSGAYSATYTAPNGCVSPASAPAQVTVKSHSSSTTNVTICSSQLPYIWNGNNYNATGAYNVTLVNAAGCDSLATLNLTVNTTPAPPVITAGGPTTFCQGNFVTLSTNKTTGNNWSTGATTQSIVVAASGNYSATYTAPNGCTSSSSVPVTVTVTTSSVSTTNATTCSSQLPYIWNGNNYTASGVYNVVLTNQTGCDSVAILILDVVASTSSTANVTRCSNQLPYNWNGVDYTVSGVYTVTGLTNAAGCDSTATLMLTVNQTTSSTTDATVCTNQLPFVWNNTNYSTTGTYSVTLTNAAGCDSVATLNLTVNESPTAGITNNSGTTVLTCTQTSVSVTATGGVSYSWSDGTTVVGTTENLTITTPGTYT
ncbi:MAG: DUF4082 domain-containing protein, partial [Chitinophagaceae bacterium]|nr:DUF4082 domain-containing protein [Chitinophagaceae bacterium]